MTCNSLHYWRGFKAKMSGIFKLVHSTKYFKMLTVKNSLCSSTSLCHHSQYKNTSYPSSCTSDTIFMLKWILYQTLVIAHHKWAWRGFLQKQIMITTLFQCPFLAGEMYAFYLQRNADFQFLLFYIIQRHSNISIYRSIMSPNQGKADVLNPSGLAVYCSPSLSNTTPLIINDFLPGDFGIL